MKILVLDIGGSSVKVWMSPTADRKRVQSGDKFTPQDLVRETKGVLGDLKPDRVSIGYPGLVRWGRPAKEPQLLGKGWLGFDFERAFEVPVRIMNDAEMQALGGYEGGRMLYLGLGTGVGTTLITEAGISQLALGLLPFKDNKPFEQFLRKAAMSELGLEPWRRAVAEAASLLKSATIADYVLIGGGGVEELGELPTGCRRGGNTHAYFGGLRMWEDIRLHSAVLGRAP